MVSSPSSAVIVIRRRSSVLAGVGWRRAAGREASKKKDFPP
jgi:hypothetical protein